MSRKKILFTVNLLLFIALSSGCASEGWQKFSPGTVLQNSSVTEKSSTPTQLEVFIFADGEQTASQAVIDI